jgi:hypothetical protein
MYRNLIAPDSRIDKQPSLREVIYDLIFVDSSFAARKGDLIFNEVNSHIRILNNPKKIRGILKRILDLIILVTKKSQIRISAKTYTNVVLVHFKENNIQNISFVSDELRHLSPEAEQLGGYLGITRYQNTFTTIVFTFLNVK